uniref:NADH-ubiquinone oxidoreductase chain 2 n=1 Tax=Trichobatrachus robustus TaxID=111096 RepID=W0TL94_TRIRB|nr:NADH dehydrogenase subunit 2 [Trichobatrachus robustus]BAO42924.1 NADH dehydrogenase subunit 2 [Trichobatrachus robustus]
MNPLALTIFIISLATGTTIVLSSYHWMLAWIGLEINTLAIIPMMTKNPHPRSIEAATKYFLTQATASALLLFSLLINAWAYGEWNINSPSPSMSIPLTIALSTKLGVAPLHFWMPEVLQGIPLTTGLILATWQKIPPMTLLIQISKDINLPLIITLGLTSIIIGGWGGINQTQLRKIMAFSSIGHLGWMIIILKFNPQLTFLNFMLYIIMTSAMFITLHSLSATKITQLSSAWPKTPTLTVLSLLTLLSLGGLPPLTGFMPKLLIILELTKQNAQILAASLLLFTLIALFFYIRLAYVMTLTLAPNTTPSTTMWRTNLMNHPIAALTTMFALFLLPITPTLFLMT